MKIDFLTCLQKEDKEKIKDEEWIESVLADFYQDKINSEECGQE